jgi:hypothetical protein
MNRLTRRGTLRRLLLGAACLPLVDVWGGGLALARDGARAKGPDGAAEPRASSVIEIWLAGGPSHLDTFDPKPEAGQEYHGPLDKALETNVSGIRISPTLPLLATQADKYALIRSMTHGQNGHETASYITQTGRDVGGRLVYPSVGSVVSLFKGKDQGYAGVVPPYVVLTTPQGRFSETGFLGPGYRPFVTGGDPNQARFAVEGIVAQGITDERQRNRRDLMHELDTLGKGLPESAAFERLDRCEENAYDLILGDAGKVFDLSTEPDGVRARYGRNTFGQSCLMARRLVEEGVPYVKVHSRGWDTHKQHFEVMRRKLPELDRGVATLLADLSERGLLETTIVWCSGEFGRTPKVQWQAPWNGGRGHHGRCFSALVAGGGFQGGQVVGASDARGEGVANRPVHPRELHGAIFTQLGIDPDGPLPNSRGLDVNVTEPLARGGARLEEIV